jgi:RNAse (barnase) inhibitor barstar
VDTGISEDVDHCPSRVYLIDATECERVLRHDACSLEFDVAVLNGDAASTRAGFFTEIARVWSFRDYFGHNRDAVYDCLTDMSWSLALGFVLVIDGFDHLATNQPEE